MSNLNIMGWTDTNCYIDVPAGLYMFTVTGTPRYETLTYNQLVLGVSGIGSYESRSAFNVAGGTTGFSCTHTFFSWTNGGIHRLAIWTNNAVTVSEAEIAAVRLPCG